MSVKKHCPDCGVHVVTWVNIPDRSGNDSTQVKTAQFGKWTTRGSLCRDCYEAWAQQTGRLR